MKGKPGFAQRIGSGSAQRHYFLAMELLGPSISSLHKKPFALKTVLKIGSQMIERLKDLHAENIIHSDLKPDNMAIGLNNPDMIFLFDFGLSQTIIDADNRTLPMNIGAFVGTWQYMGIGAHNCIVSFRNDMESLGYVMLLLLKGELPWNSRTIKNKSSKLDMNTEIKSMKEVFLDAIHPDLPPELMQFFDIVKKMTQIERPNYDLFQQALG